MKKLFWMITALILGIFPASGQSQAESRPEAVAVLERIPVQNGGRIKPFESFAQESVLFITGKKKFQRENPTATVWNWMADPERWSKEPILPAGHKELQKDFGLMVIKGKISPEVVMDHQPFVEKVKDASARKRAKEKISEIDQKRLELYDKAAMFREIGVGGIPGWLAHPEDPRVGWLPFQAFLNPESDSMLQGVFPAENLTRVRSALQELLTQYKNDPASTTAFEAAELFRSEMESLFASSHIALDAAALDTERQYLKLHPFGWAWKFYGFAALSLLIFSLLRINNQNAGKFGFAVFAALFLAGFLVHTYGFYLRCIIAGRPPVSNMYESIIWVSWAAAFFSILLYIPYRGTAFPLTASIVAAFALIIADGFPTVLDPGISPLVPVLRSNFWLTVHVLTITLSYGAFALAWGLGHVTVFSYAFSPAQKELNRRFSQYLYRAVQIGVILLAVGTVLGGVWANYSWGRFWAWDPKETWALIALLGYLAVLHGRYAGWLDQFGVAVGCVAAFLGVVMAWYGVNFVLAAGLHSYGFGGGGAAYVFAVAFADIAIMAWPVLKYNQNKKKGILTTAA